MPERSDIHVARAEPLMPPAALKYEVPASERVYEVVAAGRQGVREVLARRDTRQIAIVGPCSIHDPRAALDYAEQLVRLRDQVVDQFHILMRVYFEKPRTTVGWKGLINDPHLDDSRDVPTGLRLAREILVQVNALGLPCASEFVDPIVPQYVADLVSWVAIGARTTESQTHRELASALSMPVGFKNTTDGNVRIAVQAIQAANRPHAFFGTTQDGSTAVIHTTGNPDCHVVLRGSNSGPNYDATHVAAAADACRKAGVDPRIMVDCSHGQTNKDPMRQPEVLANVVDQVAAGNHDVIGVMIESHLHAGAQPLTGSLEDLAYGVSITDGCVDLPTTARTLLDAADRLRRAATAL